MSIIQFMHLISVHFWTYLTIVREIIVPLKTIKRYCLILLISLCKNNQKTI